jgi:tetratricopeptide (TPR) repeat protein
MKDLAWSYSDLRRHKEALALRKEALKLQQLVLPNNHPEIAFSKATLALSFSKKSENAQKLLEEALSILEQSPLPGDSTNIARIKGNMANVYSKRGLHKEALEIRENLWTYWQKTSEDQNHPFITTSMRNLAESYFQVGLYKEAIELQLEVVARNKNVLPERPNDVTISMSDLARSYFEAEYYKEAIELQKEVVARNKKMLPEWDRLVTISWYQEENATDVVASAMNDLARYQQNGLVVQAKGKGQKGGGKGQKHRGTCGKGRGHVRHTSSGSGYRAKGKGGKGRRCS